jgi:hypothetical protein
LANPAEQCEVIESGVVGVAAVGINEVSARDIEVFVRRGVCDATFKLGALGIILR